MCIQANLQHAKAAPTVLANRFENWIMFSAFWCRGKVKVTFFYIKNIAIGVNFFCLRGKGVERGLRG